MDVRLRGNWEDWIKFFLRGVAEVADESTESAREILKLKDDCSKLLYEKDSNNSNYQRLLNALFEMPLVRRSDVVELLCVSNPTAGVILGLFSKSGILVDLDPKKSRNKLYAFKAYIDILNRGTEIASQNTGESHIEV